MSRRAALHRARLAQLSGQGSFATPKFATPKHPLRRMGRSGATTTAAAAAADEQYFPPIKHATEFSHESANHTVEGVGHFKTRGEARSYNTQYSVRATKVDRQVNKMGYMSKRQKGKGQRAIPQVSMAPTRKKVKKFKLKSDVPEPTAVTRRNKMRAVMIGMLNAYKKCALTAWWTWQERHREKYGMDPHLAKVNEKNEHVLSLNKMNGTFRDLPGGGLKTGDIVIFTCVEAPLSGELRPTHVVEPCLEDRRNGTLTLVGKVEGGAMAEAAQQRRGHGNNAQLPIEFWVRDPAFPLNEYEADVHARFLRKATTWKTFLLEGVAQSDLDIDFPEQFLKMPRGWKFGEMSAAEKAKADNVILDEPEEEEMSESSDDEDWVSFTARKSPWFIKVCLVPDAFVQTPKQWKFATMGKGLQTLKQIQTRWAWATYTRQIRKKRRSDGRDAAATVIQASVRAYQARGLARHEFHRLVRRDRREQRARVRVARMARRELRQRRDKRSWKKNGVTVDGLKFFRNHLALDQDWHKKQVAAAILKPHVTKLKNRIMDIVFQRWNDHRLRFIAMLAIQAQTEEANKMSGADMAEIFEQKHAGDFERQSQMASKWDDTEDHPPWHPAVNIRMPMLPTEHSIGAVSTKEGKVKINDIDRWNYWKDRMGGPIENSHWLLRGPDGKNGPSVYANVLVGGYPTGLAKKAAGLSLKNDALVALLSAGIDTFVCLMPRDEVKATEEAFGLLEKMEKQRRLRRELEDSEANKEDKGGRRRVSGVARKGRRGSALSNFTLREAEKEFEKKNEIDKNKRLLKLGPDPAYYKLQLVEHHARLQKEMSVGLEATRKRYERALAGAEKAHTYAAAQRAIMEAKRADALEAAQGAQRMFDILSKEVRFVDWGLSEEELAPGSPEREASFMKLIENIERRLRRRERIYVFSKQGHGRAGLFAACLLGHLYGLRHTEALEIVQRSHDARKDMELTVDEVVGTATVKWRNQRFYLHADERDIPATTRKAQLFSRGAPRVRVSCPRHAVQRHFVRKFLVPMATMYNPVDLRGESGPVAAYSMSREEVFAESQTHVKNKFREAREQKNLALAMSTGIGAEEEES